MTSSGARTDTALRAAANAGSRSRTSTREFVIEREQTFRRPIDEVFSFFADARYLPLLIPEWIRFGMVDAGPVRMARGIRIDYAVRLHGIPFRWQSEITVWEPMRRFVDEQRRGPFRWWIHSHAFEEPEPGSTAVRDVISYGVPGGALIDRLIVAPDLERIFSHRRRRLEQILGETAAAESSPALQKYRQA